jgi:Pyrimidine dimer DNA glycosylase
LAGVVRHDGLVRLWSLHPRYLDRQGLTAAWREALLAQAVLAGRTRGYTRHPQLRRFRATAAPLASIGAYLEPLADEATVRGYHYDRRRILEPPHDRFVASLHVTEGQLAFEWRHLTRKLEARSPDWLRGLPIDDLPLAHPLFVVAPGGIEDWEIV